MLIAFLLMLAGAASIYLSSSHQSWFKHPLPSVPGRIGGGLLLVLSWIWLSQSMHSLAAVFLFASLLMPVLMTLPYLGAVLQLWRIGKPHE